MAKRLARELSDVQLRAELGRLARLPVFDRAARPRLAIVRDARGDYTGWATYENDAIELRIGPTMTVCEAHETLLHELAHLRCGPRSAHGKAFHFTLDRARREAYGADSEATFLSGGCKLTHAESTAKRNGAVTMARKKRRHARRRAKRAHKRHGRRHHRMPGRNAKGRFVKRHGRKRRHSRRRR